MLGEERQEQFVAGNPFQLETPGAPHPSTLWVVYGPTPQSWGSQPCSYSLEPAASCPYGWGGSRVLSPQHTCPQSSALQLKPPQCPSLYSHGIFVSQPLQLEGQGSHPLSYSLGLIVTQPLQQELPDPSLCRAVWLCPTRQTHMRVSAPSATDGAHP